MLKFCIVLSVLISHIQGFPDDSVGVYRMPVLALPQDDEYLKTMYEEMSKLKSSDDNLKLQLEDHQSQFDILYIKLEMLANRTEKIEDFLKEMKKTKNKRWPSSCDEALQGTKTSGIYSIQIDAYGPDPFEVFCDAQTEGGNWIVVQRREDGSIDFLQDWNTYKKGFGKLDGEFFMGLEKLHSLTIESPHELLIELEDFEDARRYAKYDTFAIAGESENYAICVLGKYSGTAGDSFSRQKTMEFSTKDRDNDKKPDGSCAVLYKGAWWYDNCFDSNLNGLYLKGQHDDRYGEGMVWRNWKGYSYSYKKTQMLIRPKKH